MRILRFFLLLASTVGAAYIFRALYVGGVPSVERSTAWLFGLGLVLNIIFLLFCGPVATGTSRFSYILRLWYIAKVRELRGRAGEPPQLD
jgi:multisubunit Na+/H+ antiporter MnhG subunit